MVPSDIYVKKNDTSGTKLQYLQQRTAYNHNSIPDIEDICRRIIRNHNIHRLQKSNKLLYHERIE